MSISVEEREPFLDHCTIDFDTEYITKLVANFYNGKKEYASKIWYLLMFETWYKKWMG